MYIESFVEYNYIGEIAGLLLSGLLLFVMLYVRPKKTLLFKYIFNGTILSIVAILFQISIIKVANNPNQYYNKNLFGIQLISFLLVYNGILYCIFSYVNMMSVVRRNQRKEFILMYAVLSIIYVIGIIIEIAASGLYTFTLDGIDIRHFTRYYISAGIVCAVVCFIASILNRREISRITWHAVCLFVPTSLVVLIAQMIYVVKAHYIFSATTYVPIFMIGFLLFHNVPYDEISGTQSIYALDAYLMKNLTKNMGKKRIWVVYVLIKTLDIENFIKKDIDSLYYGISICRNLENLSPSLRLFKLADDKFVNTIEENDPEKARKMIQEMRAIFDKSRVDLTVPFNYTIIAGEIGSELDSILKIRQFFEYVSRRFVDQNNSQFYMAQKRDYESFAEHYEISSVIRDIRLRENLDDERVVVYAQPIYSVETGSFRSAEALMRLKVGEKLISPEVFIPIAEKSGSIHILSCIILNKVCSAISSFNEYYDFDAISINCSSKELSMDTLNRDFMEIIEKYDIDPSKIRLEVTETAMFENYETANRNMETLSAEGIQFYLDDFGTGYSSLERVMNCPFKTIKFDKTLLYKSLHDDRMNDILSYMIEVFKKNGFITLIEGVEDESQKQYSVDRGFDYIQGYLYAKPTPIEEIKKFFNRKSSF
ncbi:EAL domain-containing protein [Butyrivibrio sp.]|uniref:EAL domain-containing protein n=1 Tax=Butyrivibrio sp. TaxID=28121 RepID=UPI0025BB6E22|nr:EAL domain-containing protein [Butyrivibrio sp.]MBQ9303251.1 EAL domain-containing protein [Butyrivibrio sp.]